MAIAARSSGVVIGGGGTYIAAILLAPDLAPTIAFGAAGVMAVLGGLFGPKIWEAILHLF